MGYFSFFFLEYAVVQISEEGGHVCCGCNQLGLWIRGLAAARPALNVRFNEQLLGMNPSVQHLTNTLYRCFSVWEGGAACAPLFY